jgi:hypothetical protein
MLRECLLRNTTLSSRRRGGTILKPINYLVTKINLVMSPDGARYQERMCWRGPNSNLLLRYAVISPRNSFIFGYSVGRKKGLRLVYESPSI